jgi:hypothetical protein
MGQYYFSALGDVADNDGDDKYLERLGYVR